MKIVFISDFFSEHIIGGAEKNDDVLLNHLSNKFDISKIRSADLTESIIMDNEFFIISNFTHITENLLCLLSSKKYIIYEHDHKYVDSRNPADYPAFKIPRNRVVNKFLYKRAYKIFVLSSICKKVLENSLCLNNVVNIGTSLWSSSDLSKIEDILLSDVNRKDEYCILHSNNPIKGYKESVRFLKSKNIDFNVISSTDQKSIWTQMRENNNFIFLPTTLETFSRITCEAKMLGCKVLTKPGLVGFFSENINLSGIDLINEIKTRIEKALFRFEEEIIKMAEPKKTICFIGKFDEIYDEEGKSRALEKVGFRVIRFEEQRFNRAISESESLLFNSSPDYVFFPKLRIPNKQIFLDKCKALEIKTVCWVPDLYFGIEREDALIKDPIFKSDFVFTPDGGNSKSFQSLGINHTCVRQGLSEDYLFNGDVEKDIDIMFVGTLQPMHLPFRENLISRLAKTYGNRFHWYGRRGDRELRNDELEEKYSRAKIVVGDCVNSSQYWSNRVYEVTGRSCLLVHPRVDGLEDHFEDGKEIVLFDREDLDSLIEKIDFLLGEVETRRKVSKQGFEKTRSHNLLYHRALEIKELIL